MRATASVFVWAIESVLLSLAGLGTVALMHFVGGTSAISLDVWGIVIIFVSSLLNLFLHTVVAFTSKQPILTTTASDDKPDTSLHKAIAQGHSCVVTLILLIHSITMIHSLSDLNWASAYYPSAPGLVWVTGNILLAFFTVLWFLSITGSWSATAIGESNSLFATIPTTAILCIVFPILNEVGYNGLVLCSDPMSTTLAILYANLSIATSFCISLLDAVEFDPARILPKFMRTIDGRLPKLRIYSVIHGTGVSVTLIMYWIVARKVSTATVMFILTLNGIVTLGNTLSGVELPTIFGNSDVDDVSVQSVSDTGSEVDSGQDDPDSTDKSNTYFTQNTGWPNMTNAKKMKLPRQRLTNIAVESGTGLGSQMRATPQQPRAHKEASTGPRKPWDFMKMYSTATPRVEPAAMSISDRRIALLRLEPRRGVNEHSS